MSIVEGPLGMLDPPDSEHVEKYPLTAAMAALIVSPVVLGVKWHVNFDSPEKLGSTYWIGRGTLGRVRGGHCICARPYGWTDAAGWWPFYDQGVEGACVGFGWMRCLSLINRKRYAGRSFYFEAQTVDEWKGGAYPGASPHYEGTSVRAGGNVAVQLGAKPVVLGVEKDWKLEEGIAVYRWATDWNDIRAALGIPDSVPGVPLLNSWGKRYPHVVRITDEAGERLMVEQGEGAVVTDR